MDKKISELNSTTALQGTDERPLARTGQTLKITADDEAKFFGIKIQTSSVGYIPASTNNPDKNKVAPGSNGFWYLFDGIGSAIKILDLLAGQVIVEDKNYVHNQGVASSTWNVNHGLNKYPSAQVQDSAGTMAPVVKIEHTDVNNLIVYLEFSTSGKVFCN